MHDNSKRLLSIMPSHDDYCSIICCVCFKRIKGANWDGKCNEFKCPKDSCISMEGSSKEVLYWKSKFPSALAWPNSVMCQGCRTLIKERYQSLNPTISASKRFYAFFQNCAWLDKPGHRKRGQMKRFCPVGPNF